MMVPLKEGKRMIGTEWGEAEISFSSSFLWFYDITRCQGEQESYELVYALDINIYIYILYIERGLEKRPIQLLFFLFLVRFRIIGWCFLSSIPPSPLLYTSLSLL